MRTSVSVLWIPHGKYDLTFPVINFFSFYPSFHITFSIFRLFLSILASNMNGWLVSCQRRSIFSLILCFIVITILCLKLCMAKLYYFFTAILSSKHTWGDSHSFVQYSWNTNQVLWVLLNQLVLLIFFSCYISKLLTLCQWWRS